MERTWLCGGARLTAAGRPLVMGIVNVTPDSFSDGGRYTDPDLAAEHALRLEADGAAILDLGGESTRPGAEPVGADEELRRVLPVVERLAGRAKVPLSIDTSKASVAEAALAAGATIVNDVTALTGDPRMPGVVSDSDCGVCLMHLRGAPRTMQRDPRYEDVVVEVRAYLTDRLAAIEAAGVDPRRVCLDPGIGFGKTTDHNLELIRQIDALHTLGRPLLVGHSRKRFLGDLLGDPTADRTAATVGVALALAARGVEIVRVHDVRPVVDALTSFAACGGARPGVG